MVVRGHGDGCEKTKTSGAAFHKALGLPEARKDDIMPLWRRSWIQRRRSEGPQPTTLTSTAAPPTSYIYIIGGVGYPGGPHRQTMITHRLDLKDFRIQRMETTGDKPPPGQ